MKGTLCPVTSMSVPRQFIYAAYSTHYIYVHYVYSLSKDECQTLCVVHQLVTTQVCLPQNTAIMSDTTNRMCSAFQ